MFNQDRKHSTGRRVGTQVTDATAPLHEELLEVLDQTLSGFARMAEVVRQPVNPRVEFTESEPGQTSQVSAGVPGDKDADWRRDGDPGAMGQDPADQDPPDATVAVPIRVDGLELSMCDRSLGCLLYTSPCHRGCPRVAPASHGPNRSSARGDGWCLSYRSVLDRRHLTARCFVRPSPSRVCLLYTSHRS